MAWLDLGSGDDCLVEISADNGTSWAPLGYLTGHHNYWDVYGWLIPEDYKTAHFRFRFRLVSNFIAFETEDGVYIDDVGIGTVLGSKRYEYWMGKHSGHKCLLGRRRV